MNALPCTCSLKNPACDGNCVYNGKRSLHNELRMLLVNSPQVYNSIALAEFIGPVWDDHKRDAERNNASMIYPKLPPGENFAKDSFWDLFHKKMVWHWAFFGSPAKQSALAEWLRRQREQYMERGNWPPAPITTRRITAVPQVRTGH